MHYSVRTEETYVHWVRAFIRFHDVRHPASMGAAEVEQSLTWLATERNVAASTHRQALSALLYFYEKVLGHDLPWMQEIGRPRVPRRLPVVLSVDEVARVLGGIEQPEHRLLAELLYGTGMRLTEALQLRVKDVEFDRGAIVVREGKGGKDRVVMLPLSVVPALRAQMARGRVLWSEDRAVGRSGVYLPRCAGAQVPAGRRVVVVVLGVSAGHPLHRPSLRGGASTSPVRPVLSACVQGGGRQGRSSQAGDTAHTAALIRDPRAPGWLRHPHGSGAPRAFGRLHDDDLHACAQGRGWGRTQSSGFAELVKRVRASRMTA